MRTRKNLPGFTLIELMLVAAIIGLLSAIAIPKFADLITKAKEAAVRGSWGSLKSAWYIFMADTSDMEDYSPYSPLPNPYWAKFTDPGGPLHGILVPKYINEIPKITTNSSHPRSNFSILISAGLPIADLAWNIAMKVAYHFYTESPGPPYGQVKGFFINCTHSDLKGIAWSQY